MPAGESFDCDVMVVGAGPCGLATSHLLGTYGIDTMLVEREVKPLDYPRAVGIDDESLRTCQTFDMADAVLRDAVQNTPIRYYTSWGRCLAHVKPSAQPFGWPRRNLFLQPMFEATLRSGLSRHHSVTPRFGWQLVSFAQDVDRVTAQLADPAGQQHTVRARYLVAADGGKSAVRKELGVPLEGETSAVRWLVVDVADDYLDAPYSAVYCDPRQPVLMIPLPFRHRRWEFKLQPGDDEARVTELDSVRALISARYGTTPLPTIVRARVYTHHSRTAQRFGVGRVFLAGDAAHLQPPFFGQGMNSGMRDATNLAWKLAAVIKGQAWPDLLTTYDSERRPHATKMVQFATRMGAMYSPRNVATERIRDLAFRGVQTIPGGRDYVLQMKYKPMPFYTDGAVLHRANGGTAVGRMFMQPDVETQSGSRCKLDDAIGPSMAVVGVGVDPRIALDTETIAWWTSMGATFVEVAPSKSTPRILADVTTTTPDSSRHVHDRTDDNGYLVVEDVDGAFRDWLLARPSDNVIVLRPDRYVAAVANHTTFGQTTAELRKLFSA
jgi:3-(3-hydroxy-phenyl)propionate hydroxylase